MTRRPVSVAPVKPIFLTVGLTSNSSPTTLPGPVTTFKTPLGPPASWIALSMISQVAEIGQRRGAGRLDDDGVTREQRWTELVAH